MHACTYMLRLLWLSNSLMSIYTILQLLHFSSIHPKQTHMSFSSSYSFLTLPHTLTTNNCHSLQCSPVICNSLPTCITDSLQHFPNTSKTYQSSCVDHASQDFLFGAMQIYYCCYFHYLSATACKQLNFHPPKSSSSEWWGRKCKLTQMDLVNVCIRLCTFTGYISHTISADL